MSIFNTILQESADSTKSLQTGYHTDNAKDIWAAALSSWNTLDREKAYKWAHNKKDYEVNKIRRALTAAGYSTTSTVFFASSSTFDCTKLLIVTKEPWTSQDIQKILEITKNTLKDLMSYAARQELKYVLIVQDTKDDIGFYYLENSLENNTDRIEENKKLSDQITEYLKNKSTKNDKNPLKVLCNKISNSFYNFSDVSMTNEAITATYISDEGQVEDVYAFENELEKTFKCNVSIGRGKEVEFTDNGRDEPDYFYEYSITFEPKQPSTSSTKSNGWVAVERDYGGKEYKVKNVTDKKAAELAALLDDAFKHLKKFKSREDYWEFCDTIVTSENLKKWLPDVYIGKQAPGKIQRALYDLSKTKRFRKTESSKNKIYEECLYETESINELFENTLKANSNKNTII